jgi:hypothetical protein
MRWTSPAYSHACRELQLLCAQLERAHERIPSRASRFVMLGVLREVLADDSVYPTLADDAESGLIAEWRADEQRIEINVDHAGQPFFRVRRRNGPVMYEGASTVQLRRHLRDVTALVNSVNPGWRSLFARGNALKSA